MAMKKIIKKHLVWILIFSLLNLILSGCSYMNKIEKNELEDYRLIKLVTTGKDTINFANNLNVITEINDSLLVYQNYSGEKIKIPVKKIDKAYTDEANGIQIFRNVLLVAGGILLAAYVGFLIALDGRGLGG